MTLDFGNRARARPYVQARQSQNGVMSAGACCALSNWQSLNVLCRDCGNVVCDRALDRFPDRLCAYRPSLREPTRRSLHSEAKLREAGGVRGRAGRQEGAGKILGCYSSRVVADLNRVVPKADCDLQPDQPTMGCANRISI